MKKSKLRVIIVFSVITFLILGSVGSFGSSNNENKTYLKTKTMVRNSAVCFNTFNSEDELNTKKLNTLGDIGYNSYDNVVVTNSAGNESYPSMIREGYNSLVAYEYEDDTETSIYLRYSRDYGQTWSGESRIIAKLDGNPIEINSPSLSIVPLSNRAYGMYKSPLKDSAVFGYCDIGNIVDPTSVITYTFDWTGFPDPEGAPGITYAFWDFETPQIITYKNTTTPWVIALTGSTNYTYEGVGACTDSPMFCFPDLLQPDKYVTLTWYSEIEYCSNITLSRNYGDSIIYGICEINNGSNQDLLFFKGNPKSWYDGDDLNNQTLTSSSSLTHPHINVTKNNIFIVADSDSDGIILYNSSDSGKSWYLKDVTADIIPPSANPNYPMIYSNDVSFLCTYIESDNIYLTRSTNDGLNWSDPIQLNSINDSAVEEYRFSDLIDEHHILWTDNREGNHDIYSILLDIPEVDLSVIPESVTLDTENKNVPFLLTKNWIAFTIKNNGNISVEKVPVNITYTCINSTPQKTEYKVTIYYLPPGGEESFRRPLFRLTLGEFINALLDYAGIQEITVTVDPDNKYSDRYPLDNSYSISVTYKDIFPRLGFLENLFL